MTFFVAYFPAFISNLSTSLDVQAVCFHHARYMGQGAIPSVTLLRRLLQEQPVIEYYWWCRMDRYQSISTDEWTENDGLFLYSAYLDTRRNSLYPHNNAIQGTLCEIWQRGWDQGGSLRSIDRSETQEDHFYIPNLITCPIPRRFDSSAKLFVSISSQPCSAQRAALRVRVTKSTGEKEAVAVCVKGMDFQEDVSIRLVEWLEAQYLLGVSTVTTYVYTVPKRVKKVLDHYGKLGKLEQIPLTLPGHSPNLPLVRSQYIARNRQQKRRHELIPYNDCLYSTANVATVFNHFALHRLTPNVTGTIYVPERLGIKLHYKATCPIEARKGVRRTANGYGIGSQYRSIR
ncbi:hypothetical protein OSTOST_19514 [Ostertagia ostertagi]